MWLIAIYPDTNATARSSCNITNFLSYLFLTFYDCRKESIIITWSLIRKKQHSASFLAEQKRKW